MNRSCSERLQCQVTWPAGRVCTPCNVDQRAETDVVKFEFNYSCPEAVDSEPPAREKEAERRSASLSRKCYAQNGVRLAFFGLLRPSSAKQHAATLLVHGGATVRDSGAAPEQAVLSAGLLTTLVNQAHSFKRPLNSGLSVALGLPRPESKSLRGWDKVALHEKH